MTKIKLTDIPKIPSVLFNYHNSVRYEGHPGFFELLESGEFKIKDRSSKDRWLKIRGWSEDNGTISGREEQIMVMVDHPDYPEGLWEHFPIFQEDHEDAVFLVN